MPDASIPNAEGETARALGRVEAKVAGIEDRIERLEASSALRMAAIEQKLDGVVNTLAQSLGAMKLMHWLGGIALAGLGYLASVFMRGSR
jgi:hypothetical protein